ncbi:heavy-metal-associated domain-containing protein [Flavobacterium sp. SUN052]|uniref:heavy-metal-associated domain-containing protein n=1 Tax=Flavobacterium sp. SUN052 TaxID=3002441 RepID=UPI00237D8DB6|nr:heavy-metal-associated domain-containing protein [Flavobacterium sp. SUN052]MEC4004177.1 heavy-metal-associated domain-containing protein [Flavobacterium sp. SUN052]
MKFSKSIVSLALSAMLFVACNKNTASKPADDITETTTKKEVAAAVKPETASFTIDGMVCPDGCAKTIEKKLSAMDGVQNAKIDFEKKEATVNFDLDKLKSEDLVKAVETTGDGKTYKVSNVKTGTKV